MNPVIKAKLKKKILSDLTGIAFNPFEKTNNRLAAMKMLIQITNSLEEGELSHHEGSILEDGTIDFEENEDEP